MLITIFKKENYLVTIPVSTSIVSYDQDFLAHVAGIDCLFLVLVGLFEVE
jgi:hypothetical protein